MAGGLETTFAVLAKTRNEAAVRTLLGALDSSDRSVQVGALRALLARRSLAGQRELLGRWHTLSNRWKTIIADSRIRLSNAMREAILSSDLQLHGNGCNAAVDLLEYELIPVLIMVAEQSSDVRADRSAEALLLLADSLSEELATQRDYRNRRDPRLMHARVAGALAQSVQRYDQHHRREIVEAFLLLARPRNAVLNHILQHPHDNAYLPLLRQLSHSPRRGVMQLILDSLDDPRAPSVIYSILARRKDVSFVRHMLKRFADGVPKAARNNLRRIDSFSWLRQEMILLSALNADEQRGAIHLIMASGMNRLQVFEVVDFILEHGAPEARREAASALAEFRGAEASECVVRTLEDEDPEVCANAVRQLRECGARGAMTTLFDLIESPHEAVREAARESLPEFTFSRFLATFETLDDDLREATGRFVKRVDPHAVDSLRHELTSPIRVRRLRAIRMAIAMSAISEVEPLIVDLLFDDDHVIRAAAAESLAASPSASCRRALRSAVLDRSEIVRDAAERALQACTKCASTQSPALHPLPLDLPGGEATSAANEAVR